MMLEEWVKKKMRFTTAELDQILPLLHLEDIQWSYDYRPSPQKALCIFLARLSWPLRLHDMVEWFGYSRSQLSIIFNDVAIFLYQRFRNKLFFDRQRLTQQCPRLPARQSLHTEIGTSWWTVGLKPRLWQPGETSRYTRGIPLRSLNTEI